MSAGEFQREAPPACQSPQNVPTPGRAWTLAALLPSCDPAALESRGRAARQRSRSCLNVPLDRHDPLSRYNLRSSLVLVFHTRAVALAARGSSRRVSYSRSRASFR